MANGYEYTTIGGDGDDLLVATDGNDTIDGGANSDVILGDAGNDTLTGGTGRDIIRGGSGNDSLSGGDHGDIILGGTGVDTINGDAGNDLLLGGTGDDLLKGGTGNDTLIGGAGNDELWGGAGADTFKYVENSGSDTIKDFDVANDMFDLSLMATALAYTDLTITDHTNGTDVEISHTSFGTITLSGVRASQLSESHFSLPDGTTTEFTTGENDVVQRYENPTEGDDTSDILIDQSNDTRIVAKGGDDLVLAGEGDDKLEGGAGEDTLLGEEGNDTLTGGADDDWLHGGSGNDTFVFEGGHGNDTIQDFSDGSDLIDLTALTEITAWNDISSLVSADGTAAVIDLSTKGGGSIRLEGVAVADLDADDFDFYESMMQDDTMEGG